MPPPRSLERIRVLRNIDSGNSWQTMIAFPQNNVLACDYINAMPKFEEDSLTVIVFAEDSLSRHGLAALLEPVPAIVVILVESPAQLTQDKVRSGNVLVWQIGWDFPDADSAEVWETITDLAEDGVPVIAILPDGEDPGIARQMGLAGLLPRSVKASQLRAALYAAAEGLSVTDPALTSPFWMPSTPSLPPIPEPPTPRELEVLGLLAEGLTNRAIGVRLGITENTAKFHVQAVLSKLGASSRTEAVVQATRLGLLTL